MEPVSIFTPVASAADVLDAMRAIEPKLIVDIEPAQGVWRSATFPLDPSDADIDGDGALDRWPLRVNHAPDYYDGPDWEQQLLGLRAYFGQWDVHARTEPTFAVLSNTRSAYATALSCRLDLDAPIDTDPRLALLYALAVDLDALIFTPSGLRDSHGRMLVSASGPHPDAVVPKLRSESSVVAADLPDESDRVDRGSGVGDSGVGDSGVGDSGVEASGDEQAVAEAEAVASVVGRLAAQAMAMASAEQPTIVLPAPETGPGPETQITLDPPAVEVDLRTSGPSARRVALRALALTAVCSRAFLEQDDPDEVDQEGERSRIERWAIEVHGLDDELEPDEWQLLQAGIEMIDARKAVDAAWRIEGLAVLVWALGLTDLPDYDALADTDLLNDAVGFLDVAKANEVVSNATLRTVDRLQVVHDQTKAVHWRLREFRLQPGPIDFLTHCADSLLGSLDSSLCRFAGDDLAIRCDGEDLAISVADEDTVDQVLSVADERFLAARWLLVGGTFATTSVNT